MSTQWQWVACGKHPAARDYIRIGNQFPLGSNLFGWVEQGFTRCFRSQAGQQSIKWRFWMRGTARDQLACGILSQSCDAIGRPYPLLLMGSGISPKWEECWENLPMTCENAWSSAELLFSDESTTVPELVTGLAKLPSPVDILLDDTLPPALSLKSLNGEMDSEFCLFSLESLNGSRIEVAAAMRLSLLLKKKNALPPVAVFIGGREAAHMAVMRRPLKPLDFDVLWNLQ